MDSPFLNTRLRYSRLAYSVSLLSLINSSFGRKFESGPTMGVAATTHNHNHLLPIIDYRACINVPYVSNHTRASRWCCLSSRGKGVNDLLGCRLDDKNRTWTSKETSSRVTDGGVSSSMKFKTWLERKGRDDTLEFVGLPLREACLPSSNCIKLFARSENLLRVCVCVRACFAREKL